VDWGANNATDRKAAARRFKKGDRKDRGRKGKNCVSKSIKNNPGLLGVVKNGNNKDCNNGGGRIDIGSNYYMRLLAKQRPRRLGQVGKVRKCV